MVVGRAKSKAHTVHQSTPACWLSSCSSGCASEDLQQRYAELQYDRFATHFLVRYRSHLRDSFWLLGFFLKQKYAPLQDVICRKLPVRKAEDGVKILTKVRVANDPKKQMMIRPRTKNSLRLLQTCGNSSSTPVITPSNPANWKACEN